MPDLRRLPAPLRLLLGSQFGLYLLGNSLSLVGTWMQRIACGWLIWDWTHSAFWLGILAAGDLLPVVVIGPFAGVAADRWDRLRQNMLSQAISALLAVLTAVLMATDLLGLISLVLLVTVQGALTSIIQPARLAMVQQMVSREDMGAAVALNSVSVNLTRLLGPAVAGAMIVYVDIAWIFAVNAAVTFLFVVILNRLSLVPHKRRSNVRSFFGEMTEGFVHILHDQALWLILLVMLCGGSMVRAIVELMPAVAAGTFSDNATGLAVLSGAVAFGAVASGLSIGERSTVSLLLGVLLWWGLGAVAAIVLTQAQGSSIAVVGAIFCGFTINRGLVMTQTFVQLTTPDGLRGRVLSVHGLLARGSPALGALVIGFAADRIGLAHAMMFSSGTLILSLLVLVPLVRGAAPRLKDKEVA